MQVGAATVSSRMPADGFVFGLCAGETNNQFCTAPRPVCYETLLSAEARRPLVIFEATLG
jgi:hypothetical protein